MQKFLIPMENIEGTKAVIKGQDARHIHKVLRHKKGDIIDMTNGHGMDFKGKIQSLDSSMIELTLVFKNQSTAESDLEIIVCSGMLKHQKMDLVIKQLTQLGIYKWIPFFCERSIPLPDPKGMKKKLARWEAISRESIKQCRRSRLVTISEPLQYKTVLDLCQDYDHKIAFWEESSLKLKDLASSGFGKTAIILIGPEGGFSKQEIAMAEAKGFAAYSLGPRILRAETASVCACTLVQHILGDM